MKKVLFISVKEVKENTIIESNTDERIIANAINEVQELELLPLIGKDTYNRLKDEVLSGATVSGYTLSDAHSELLEIIKPVLIYGTLVYSFIPIHFKYTNKGLMKKTDDNATGVDKTEMELMRSHYTVKFENYKKRLADYLIEDEDPSTNPATDVDTTYGGTGLFINDSNEYDLDEYFLSRAYKTGYIRRG